MEKKSVKNKVIHSFSEVDLTAIAIPAIAIYKYPKDIPDKYVARVYACSNPTNVIMLADSAEELRKEIEDGLIEWREIRKIWSGCTFYEH